MRFDSQEGFSDAESWGGISSQRNSPGRTALASKHHMNGQPTGLRLRGAQSGTATVQGRKKSGEMSEHKAGGDPEGSNAAGNSVVVR